MSQHDKGHHAAATPDFHKDDITFVKQQNDARAVQGTKPASSQVIGRARSAAGVLEQDEEAGLTLAEREALEEAKRNSALNVDVADIPVTPEAEDQANRDYLTAQDAALGAAVGTAPWQLDPSMAAVMAHMARAEDEIVDFVTGERSAELPHARAAQAAFDRELGNVIKGPGHWFAVDRGLEREARNVSAGEEDVSLIALLSRGKGNGTDALAKAA